MMLIVANNISRLWLCGSRRLAIAQATNVPNIAMSKNGTVRKTSGGIGTPMKPPGRAAPISAPQIPMTTMHAASSPPKTPARR